MSQRLAAPWLKLPSLQHLFDIFEKADANLRLVGGSVRDGLLNLPVSDIDLAVDRDPHWVMELLTKNEIKTIPTGIDHGTVTAIIDKRPFQITTLRVDVKTFGRKAHVEFTDDWVQDALRRDFTINAIYADRQGQLFDPVQGLVDLEERRVRFIGEASQRIKEDYLRILRFFRFSARFGHEPFEADGLTACEKYASHLPHLARERVTDEFLKLLELHSPLYAFEAMNSTGVLSYILHPGTWDDLKALIKLEQELSSSISALLRLAAFHPHLEEVKKHLRLSKKQEQALAFLTHKHPWVDASTFKHQAYHSSINQTFDLALLQTAHKLSVSEISLPEGIAHLQSLHQHFDDWTVPSFPVTGADLIQLGIKEGKEVGQLLKSLEKWWLSQDLQPNKAACLAHLSTLL